MSALKDALVAFEKAVRADETKGAGFPEDIELVEADLAEARKELEELLALDKRVYTAVEIRMRTAWPRGTRFIEVQP